MWHRKMSISFHCKSAEFSQHWCISELPNLAQTKHTRLVLFELNYLIRIEVFLGRRYSNRRKLTHTDLDQYDAIFTKS